MKKARARLRVVWSYLGICTRMALLILLRRPYKLTLLVTDGCNLRCQMCSIWKKTHQFLSLAEAQQIWSAFPLKPCWVNISGGEPTLNPELSAILQFFASVPHPLLITLTTNGQIDPTPIIEPVLRANKTSLIYASVSLDGEQPTHDAIRGQGGAFVTAHHALNALQALSHSSPALQVGISTTLSATNLRLALPFLAQRTEQVPVSVNLAQYSDYYGNSASAHFTRLPPDDLITALRAIQYMQPRLSLASFLKINFLESVIRYLEGTYTPIPCSSAVDHVLITADLGLVDCSVFFRPWNTSPDTRDARLRELIETVRFPGCRQRILRKHLNARNCEHSCHTPCEAYIHLLSGLFRVRLAPKLIATYLRRTLESWLMGREYIERTISRFRQRSLPRDAALEAISAHTA